MKRIATFLLCIALITSCLSGCVVVNFTDNNALMGIGDQEIYEYEVGEYSGISAQGIFEIHYFAARSGAVILEVQPNLQEYYVIEVVGGTLIAHTTKQVSLNPSNPPVLTVSTPVLSSLAIEGAGTFTAHDKITADSFTLKLSGAGQGKAELDVNTLFVTMAGANSFELSGTAHTAELRLSGAGELNAFELQTREASANLSGACTLQISCSDDLRINANGVGTVEYKGSPSLDLNNSGTVSVKKVD